MQQRDMSDSPILDRWTRHQRTIEEVSSEDRAMDAMIQRSLRHSQAVDPTRPYAPPDSDTINSITGSSSSSNSSSQHVSGDRLPEGDSSTVDIPGVKSIDGTNADTRSDYSPSQATSPRTGKRRKARVPSWAKGLGAGRKNKQEIRETAKKEKIVARPIVTQLDQDMYDLPRSRVRAVHGDVLPGAPTRPQLLGRVGSRQKEGEGREGSPSFPPTSIDDINDRGQDTAGAEQGARRRVLYQIRDSNRQLSASPDVDKLARIEQEDWLRRHTVIQQPTDPHSLTVALCGAPNAGKSTLINRLVDAKIAAISHKVQTTRENLYGLYTQDNTQLAFCDTPGIFAPTLSHKHRAHRSLVPAALQGANDADLILVMVDGVKTPDASMEYAFERLDDISTPKILVVNKADLMRDRIASLPIIQWAKERLDFEEVVSVSALNGQGVGLLRSQLLRRAIPRDWSFSPDIDADISPIKLCEEMVREKLFRYMNKELPYTVDMHTKYFNYQEEEDTLVIGLVLTVANERQKGIILGHQGSRLKRILDLSAHDISKALQVSQAKIHVYFQIPKK